MSNETVEIIITTDSFNFREGEVHEAIPDDDGFLVVNSDDTLVFVSDGECELTGEEHE